jgi:hypothetical protein
LKEDEGGTDQFDLVIRSSLLFLPASVLALRTSSPVPLPAFHFLPGTLQDNTLKPSPRFTCLRRPRMSDSWILVPGVELGWIVSCSIVQYRAVSSGLGWFCEDECSDATVRTDGGYVGVGVSNADCGGGEFCMKISCHLLLHL